MNDLFLVVEKIIEMLECNNDKYGNCESLLNWLEIDKDFNDLTVEDFEFIKETTDLEENQIKIAFMLNPFVENLSQAIYNIKYGG